ncbi:hypothetical protein SEA_RANA_50 [Streptomyces phage Rana]|uniref:Uncharacterized protein n=1 Tax=Streptomyces phage Lorelei TaxID=1873996 RepID=A0A1C9LWJ2_9CAUD|nr:hypothetical protein KGH01_gp50 [Streptomyces phage Lorelei]AOQ26945.1 hypothetical protein SEA_LORELEI_50 [Streptomyces phage Lorelei]AWN07268.1 hypothetical protein SEA_RANA_50 [Streptomyces phage Rana]AWN07344.1 hypothetical protein SEA_NABI_50 [Streptomyces phage Nabi]
MIERLADMLMSLPEEEREALLASLTGKRKAPGPTAQGPVRELPAARTEAVVTCQIEWT